MNSPSRDGLRLRNNTKSGKKYIVQVRTRPISGPGGLFATHAFIVLLDGINLIDSLSFDPSNSIGLEDGNPNDDSRGNEEIGNAVTMATWLELKTAFERAASNVYNLRYHNCTHAVCQALSDGPRLPGSAAGMELARAANNTWDALHGRLSAEEDDKKRR